MSSIKVSISTQRVMKVISSIQRITEKMREFSNRGHKVRRKHLFQLCTEINLMVNIYASKPNSKYICSDLEQGRRSWEVGDQQR